MVPDAVRALHEHGYHVPAYELADLHDSGAIELRPDAGNALTPADLALCPRGAGGVPMVTLVVREVPCSRCGRPLAWDGEAACSSCLEAT